MKPIPVIALAALMLLQCTYYHKAFKKDSQYYSEAEQRMVAETTRALAFGYGYDADVEFDYVCVYPYTKENFAAREKLLAQVVKSYDQKTFASFYEKMYYLKFLYLEQAEVYNKRKQWKYSTYILKYLLPPLEEYLAQLEKNLLQNDPGYAGGMEQRRAQLMEEAGREVAFLEEIRKRRVMSKIVNGKKPQ